MSTIRMITQPQYPPECQPKERPPSNESTPKTSEGPKVQRSEGPKVRRSIAAEGPSLPKWGTSAPPSSPEAPHPPAAPATRRTGARRHHPDRKSVV